MATFDPLIDFSNSVRGHGGADWNLLPHDASADGPLTSAAIDVVIDANVSGYETNIFPYPVSTGVSLDFVSQVYLVNNALGGLLLHLPQQFSSSSASGMLGPFPGGGRISDAKTFKHTLWGGYTFNSTITAP